jgi:hypothetical protein
MSTQTSVQLQTNAPAAEDRRSLPAVSRWLHGHPIG